VSLSVVVARGADAPLAVGLLEVWDRSEMLRSTFFMRRPILDDGITSSTADCQVISEEPIKPP